MVNIKRKAIQLKSWVWGKIKGEDEKISYANTFLFLASWYGTIPFIIFLLVVVNWILKILYTVIPFIICILDGLISTLSYYLNKKEFFYGV